MTFNGSSNKSCWWQTASLIGAQEAMGAWCLLNDMYISRSQQESDTGYVRCMGGDYRPTWDTQELQCGGQLHVQLLNSMGISDWAVAMTLFQKFQKSHTSPSQCVPYKHILCCSPPCRTVSALLQWLPFSLAMHFTSQQAQTRSSLPETLSQNQCLCDWTCIALMSIPAALLYLVWVGRWLVRSLGMGLYLCSQHGYNSREGNQVIGHIGRFEGWEWEVLGPWQGGPMEKDSAVIPWHSTYRSSGSEWDIWISI